MAIPRTYSLLHNQPAFQNIVLRRYLGIDAPSPESMPHANEGVGLPENQQSRTAEHDNHSIATNEFLADMEVDQSEFDSLYEECGALIQEGFPMQSEDDGADEIDWDMPSPQASSPNATSSPTTPAGNTFEVKPAVAFHHVTGLPIPPFMLNNPDIAVDVSPERHNHLDPTRPDPYTHYICQWERSCFERIKGASPGKMQCHLRRVHQVDDSVDRFVRCEQSTSCEEEPICGDQVPARDLGTHVCDVHWRSRAVKCPFCGVSQTHRDDVPQHWVESCAEFAKASEEEQKAWRQFWKWPAKKWLRELS